MLHSFDFHPMTTDEAALDRIQRRLELVWSYYAKDDVGAGSQHLGRPFDELKKIEQHRGFYLIFE
jgi:hypothetical protein